MTRIKVKFLEKFGIVGEISAMPFILGFFISSPVTGVFSIEGFFFYEVKERLQFSSTYFVAVLSFSSVAVSFMTPRWWIFFC